MDAVLEELLSIAKRKAAERETVMEKEPKLEELDFGKKNPSTGETSPGTDSIDYEAWRIEHERWRARVENEQPGDLKGYDCAICRNKGYAVRVDEKGYRIATPCKCMTIRNNERRIEQSGLSDLLSRYTFEAWQSEEEWQSEVLNGAKRFAANPQGWFSVCGKPGTGKTHICTAICGELMKRGYDVRYMLWRDAATTLKANSLDDAAAYSREIEPLKKVKVLYIDDFLKTGNKQPPTVMDVNLAFEIINARYNTDGLITIISSERTLDDLMRIDEATASRIYERTKQHRNHYNLAGKGNWRMKQEN